MLRLLRGALFALLSFPGCATPPAGPADLPPPDQIRWQRTLEDALAIAAVRHQPLLLAINMDGESASDRVYGERYRDPAFVAASRHCVCLVASVFRHNPRDHDDEGRRIPCPRFGEITCGEHVALEPVLFDRYLSDGDRVAPRHALIRPDGTKVFDLSLCFDLRDVDRALIAAVADAGAPDRTPVACEHRQRLLAEARVGRDPGPWLASLAQRGDPTAGDALRRLVPRLGAVATGSTGAEVTPAAFAQAVVACGLGLPIGRAVWDALQRADGGRAAALLAALAELAVAEPALRFQVFAYRALCPADGPSVASLLAQSELVTRRLGGSAPMARSKGDAMAPAADLERELDDVEKQLATAPDDPVLQAAFAKASLDLGRQALDAGRKNARFLLEDAATYWRQAVARDAGRYEWWIESARAAYFLSDFAAEAEHGRRALALATGAALGVLPSDATQLDARSAEALRWVGDAAARRLGDLVPDAGDAQAVVRDALWALGLVAASEHADASDWASFVSVCGALACRRAEAQAAEAGTLRFPASNELRAALTRALWADGRIADAPAVAERIAARAPGPESSWFAGQAFVHAAEDCRRRDDPAGAVAAYGNALARFAAAAAANPAFADDCRLRAAECWFGRGMALVRTADRVAAADCLERALDAHPDVRNHRDGLGYDCLDLVDRLVEWRDAGGDSPVVPERLCDRLAAKAPGEPFWPTAIADACIREALRADGRNPARVERETVDAGGASMRALVGLPTDRGDDWLRSAIAIAGRAQGRAPADTEADARTVLAQACAIAAERDLERGRIAGVAALLAAAAAVLDLDVPATEATVDDLRARAAAVRARLGAPRPRQREGR